MMCGCSCATVCQWPRTSHYCIDALPLHVEAHCVISVRLHGALHCTYSVVMQERR